MSPLESGSRAPTRALPVSIFVAAIVLGAGLVGCNLDENTVDFDDSDFDIGQATLSLRATSSLGQTPDELVFADLDGTVYTVTSSLLFIEEIELELPAHLSCSDIEGAYSSAVECDDQDGSATGFSDSSTRHDAELSVKGPFVLDLLTGQTDPDLGEIRIPAVNYDEIDLELQPAESGHRGVQPGDEIVGHTWIAHASFEDDAQDTRELVIRLDFDDEIDIDPDDGIDVADDGHLSVEFDVARWMQNIPLTECLLDGDLKTSDHRVFVTDDTDSGACLDMEDRLVDTLKFSAGTRVEK